MANLGEHGLEGEIGQDLPFLSLTLASLDSRGKSAKDFLYFGQPWRAWARGGTRQYTPFTFANLGEPGLEGEIGHDLPFLWPTLACLGSRRNLAIDSLNYGQPWRAWALGGTRPWTPFT